MVRASFQTQQIASTQVPLRNRILTEDLDKSRALESLENRVLRGLSFSPASQGVFFSHRASLTTVLYSLTDAAGAHRPAGSPSGARIPRVPHPCRHEKLFEHLGGNLLRAQKNGMLFFAHHFHSWPTSTRAGLPWSMPQPLSFACWLFSPTNSKSQHAHQHLLLKARTSWRSKSPSIVTRRTMLTESLSISHQELQHVPQRLFFNFPNT